MSRTSITSDADHLAATVTVFLWHVAEQMASPSPARQSVDYQAARSSMLAERCAALARLMNAAGVEPSSPVWEALNAAHDRATALAEEFS